MRDRKDVKVLIVDDEADLRKAIAFDFKRKGFNVFEAENGTQAFQIVCSDQIDIVLTDVRMPNGDGLELLDNIKARDPHLPVVMFITGFADITLDEAYDRGVDAVFAKPFDRKMLLDSVLRALEPIQERWGSRTSERIETNFSITLKFADFENAVGGKVLNIGRGGMFVGLSDNFPAVGSAVTFELHFAQGELRNLNGEGVVRWVRMQQNENRPTGCGVEFQFVDSGSRETLIEIVSKIKSKAFIPRS